MRLLHTTALELQTFPALNDVPPFAILSHTWEAGEVLFEDMVTPERRVTEALAKHGWSKVSKSCQIARAHHFDYIWIDTLCIDKSSSAELSEAINSMFAWYAFSGLCIAYMADFLDDGLSKRASASDGQAFQASRWFTRAWTLQELIAPASLVFYDADWCRVGERRFLATIISSKTSIYRSLLVRKGLPPRENLENLRRDLTSVCIAIKMNWVAKRMATREEDTAYSLLGIFDVNMPLLYGEGRQKAFLRLQEEIIKHGFDHTILAWQSASKKLPHNGRWDWVLAPLPEMFVESEEVMLLAGQSRLDNGTIHPDGLRLDGVMVCPVQAIKQADALDTCLARAFLVDHPDTIELTRTGDVCAYLAFLRCCSYGNYTARIGILLFKDRDQPDRYYRAHKSFFVAGLGKEHLTLSDRIRQKIHLDKAAPQQILLCSPPTLSWHIHKGYWPCGYNWSTQVPGWNMRDYLECKRTQRAILEPQLPSWLPDGSGLRLSDTASSDRYKVNGVLLFEQPEEAAFLLVWGSVPAPPGRAESVSSGMTGSMSADGGQSVVPWWKSESGYFCCVVDWEAFVERPYRGEDVDLMTGEWRLKTSSFNQYLMLYCDKSIIAQSLEASMRADIGSRARVDASVTNECFLGVDGVVVNVLIGRRGNYPAA